MQSERECCTLHFKATVLSCVYVVTMVTMLTWVSELTVQLLIFGTLFSFPVSEMAKICIFVKLIRQPSNEWEEVVPPPILLDEAGNRN